MREKPEKPHQNLMGFKSKSPTPGVFHTQFPNPMGDGVGPKPYPLPISGSLVYEYPYIYDDDIMMIEIREGAKNFKIRSYILSSKTENLA